MLTFHQFFKDYVYRAGAGEPSKELKHIEDGVMYRARFPKQLKDDVSDALFELMERLLSDEPPTSSEHVLVGYFSLCYEDVSYNTLLYRKDDALGMEQIRAWDRICSDLGAELSPGEISAFTLSDPVVLVNLSFTRLIPPCVKWTYSDVDLILGAYVAPTEYPLLFIESVLVDVVHSALEGRPESRFPSQLIQGPLPFSISNTEAIDQRYEQFESYHHLYKSLWAAKFALLQTGYASSVL